ncbi:MAG: hypothetical protein R2815_08290 [Flavobacteriales bacterium]
MLAWEKPAFGSPFELWREDGLLHLVLAKGARLTSRDMKELIRLIAAMDPDGKAPVLMEFPEMAQVDEPARELLRRACGANGHPIAFFTHDLECRLQGELFKRVQRPRFPFRVFGWRNDAVRWARERRQLVEMTRG